MPRRLILSFALPLLLVGASTAAAQGRRGNGADRGLVEVAPVGVRSGFFLTAGIGAGGEQYRFDGDPFTSQLTKPTVTLRLGGAPNQNVRVGGELFGWWNPVNDGVTSTESFGMLLLAAQYYPSTAGLYLKGGAGLARSGVSYYNGASTNETGFGFDLGAGWDFQVSRSVGLGPTIDLYQGAFTKRNEATLTERVLNFGVQVTFQSGRRR